MIIKNNTIPFMEKVSEHEKPIRDYSLTGINAKVSIDKRLASAEWYQTPIKREDMLKLLERRDGPAIRDTIIWFSILFSCGIAGGLLWGTTWAIFPFLVYGTIYASTSDSRWHESLHGTAFKTDFLNNALYEISSFMVFRESTPWRWSHTRHHSDTIIIGRDPEIAAPRPVIILNHILSFFAIKSTWSTLKNMIYHTFGYLTEAELLYIPDSEHHKVFFKARIYLGIYAAVIILAIGFESCLPLMYIGLPTLYGSWLMVIYGMTQHTGLAENVLDHRLNSRTIHMNLIHRFLYWNMGYHIEHHMFPLVPYHNLPYLHELMLYDSPKPYLSLWDAWKEIIPALFIQIDHPEYFVKRQLPSTAHQSHQRHEAKAYHTKSEPDSEGWIETNVLSPQKEDVIRLDYKGHTYAIYRNANYELYATDGICTHGNTHLANGFVKGDVIECPKHNGRFDIRDGSCKRAPVCISLKTHFAKEVEGKVLLKLNTQKEKQYRFRVVSNKNVATYIKELVLEPLEKNKLNFKPGEYLQFDIPVYQKLAFSNFDIEEPYQHIWSNKNLFKNTVTNKIRCRRNYSMANNPNEGNYFHFNIRLAEAPAGLDCSSGVGSSYIFHLKEGDEITALGPFGDFHIQDTHKEMVYIGGGAGMAPLHSHINHLFETLKTTRKVSYWYGARSKQDLFYTNYFENLANSFQNFNFHIALSEPIQEDYWQGHTGFIHTVLEMNYLNQHPEPKNVEYYLCGPPQMILACRELLEKYKVPRTSITCDEF